jgi:hypothetical protein
MNAEKNYTKSPLFGVIKLTLIWISKNFLKFILPIIIGLGLIIILDINFEKFKNNIFVMVIMSFENIIICYIVLSYFCISYFNKKINPSKTIKILFILIFSIIFNYIIMLLNSIEILLIIIYYIFIYISFTLFALSIINIIFYENNWGIKNGFIQIFKNKIFFFKLFIFNTIIQIIVYILLNIISYFFLRNNFDIKYFQYMIFVFSCFWSMILIVFINNKIQIEKEN